MLPLDPFRGGRPWPNPLQGRATTAKPLTGSASCGWVAAARATTSRGSARARGVARGQQRLPMGKGSRRLRRGDDDDDRKGKAARVKGLDDIVGPHREFAEGIGMLARNTSGNHRKKTVRLVVRTLEAARLMGISTAEPPMSDGCTAAAQDFEWLSTAEPPWLGG
ncbi:hypothetical protein B296_00004061 [Ensete ventricosum]|uniref:Uncharacterized protein n=1 Tax=Ensete ventricosum TaxID=4639 RepID=A0A426YEK7_ENSVE|nr:hypothetical protein B296_00004061 [Ensete ventricosum]